MAANAPMPQPRTSGSNSSAIITTASNDSATANVRAKNCRAMNVSGLGENAVAPVSTV